MEFPAEEDDAECEVPTRRPTEQDLRIAEILLELPRLFVEWESRNRRSSTLNLRWAAKRKRSKISRPPIGAVGPAPATAEPGPSKPWTDASSPDTPLMVSYSGGSSEPKSGSVATNKRKSIKRTGEELRLALSVALREKECLEGEIETLRRKIEWEKSLNMELKRKRKLLIPRQETEKAQREKVNTCLTLGVLSSPSDDAEVLYPHLGMLDVSEPLIPNRTALGADKSASSGAGATALSSLQPGVALLHLSLGPPPVPDLNLPPKESGGANDSRPLEHVILDTRFLSRAASAKARQRRYLINKAKLRR